MTMTSESVDHYIKAIYELEQAGTRAGTSALAEKLDVAPASVTGMLKRLSTEESPLVEYESHKGAALTEKGKKVALKIIRSHRLLETFLFKVLDYSWDEIHKEADRLEHYTSDLFEERIDKKMGYPKFDPHGDPIPDINGEIPKMNCIMIREMEEGQSGCIKRVQHSNPEMLRYFSNQGIIPGIEIYLEKKDPFEGPLYIKMKNEKDPVVLGWKAAGNIFVEIV